MSDADKPSGLHSTPFLPQGDNERPLTATQFQPLDGAASAPRSLPWTKLAAVVAVLFTALFLSFLFTARSLEIIVHADGEARVELSGVAIPLGSRYLLRPGNYPVSVTVPGYEPWQDVIAVSHEDSQRIDINPAILPGKVSFTSTPPGALITLNEEPLGSTPISLQSLAAGEYRLQVAAPRYQTASLALEVTGRGIEQTISTQLQPDWAEVRINSTPTANVWLNDEPAGSTDAPLEILSGEHAVTLRAPGYRDHMLSLTVVAEIAQSLGPIELIPADGVLDLSSDPSGANVSVDGVFQGRTPLQLSLSPNREHLIQLAKAGYERHRLRIQLEQGDSEQRQVSLSPELGEIAFEILPAAAELWINGRSMGRGSQTLALPAVEQRIEVRLEGYAKERLKVVPRVGLQQAVSVTLLTEAAARKAALTDEITSALGQTLVLVDPIAEPTNEFVMGASRREPGRRANEVEHPVKLERAFYIATTETTNAQFRLFDESHNSGQIEGNSLNREHQPVASVSWQQAAQFCNWLSRKEGLAPFYREQQGIVTGFNPSSSGYRLPSEAEWAYVTRFHGESVRRFAWGNDFPPNSPVVNLADNTSALVTGRILNGYADGHIVSANVASFPANPRGLFDLGGNVSEWVHDVYVIPSANAELAVDPLGQQSGDNYTLRGGSWALSRLSELRASYRDYGAAGRDDVGFRIARYAE